MVRADGAPTGVAPQVRDLVARLDGRVGITRLTTMDAVMDEAMAEPLKLRFFLWIFGGIGLLLGLVGVYGVVSYSVLRRKSELGIRAALGAGPRTLLVTVLSAGMRPVVLGTVVGLLLLYFFFLGPSFLQVGAANFFKNFFSCLVRALNFVRSFTNPRACVKQALVSPTASTGSGRAIVFDVVSPSTDNVSTTFVS